MSCNIVFGSGYVFTRMIVAQINNISIHRYVTTNFPLFIPNYAIFHDINFYLLFSNAEDELIYIRNYLSCWFCNYASLDTTLFRSVVFFEPFFKSNTLRNTWKESKSITCCLIADQISYSYPYRLNVISFIFNKTSHPDTNKG